MLHDPHTHTPNVFRILFTNHIVWKISKIPKHYTLLNRPTSLYIHIHYVNLYRLTSPAKKVPLTNCYLRLIVVTIISKTQQNRWQLLIFN